MAEDKKVNVVRNPSPTELKELMKKGTVEADYDENIEQKEEKETEIKVISPISTNIDSIIKPDESVFSPEKHLYKLVCGLHNYPHFKGYLTDNGEIYVRRMSATDTSYFIDIMKEEVSFKNFNKAITKIINNCVRTNIDTGKLYLIEKMALFIFIVSLTYGDKISFKATCPECGTVYNLELLLSDIPIIMMDNNVDIIKNVKLETYKNPIDLYLHFPYICEEDIYLSADAEQSLLLLVNDIVGKRPDGQDINEEDYLDIMKYLNDDDTKKIKDAMDSISEYGIQLDDIDVKLCKTKGCSLKNKNQKVSLPIETIFMKMFNIKK